MGVTLIRNDVGFSEVPGDGDDVGTGEGTMEGDKLGIFEGTCEGDAVGDSDGPDWLGGIEGLPLGFGSGASSGARLPCTSIFKTGRKRASWRSRLRN